MFLALESVSATPKAPSAKPRLLEPGERPARVGIEVALLLGQRVVQGLVNEGAMSLAHGQAFSARV